MDDPSVTAGSSLNILTWQQYVGDEKAENLFPSIEYVFLTKKKMRENNDTSEIDLKYCFKELHDGKMLYCLTQHSLFNQKHHPFLLCSCQRGNGVKKRNHECKIISHTEQIRFWEQSSRRWNDKRRRVKELKKKGMETSEYEYFKHMDWVDVSNQGISHFEIHPEYLPRDYLTFDVFHLPCAITCRLMNYLQKFILKQSIEIITEFTEILSTIWTDYNVLVWLLNKPFACFVGTELLGFIMKVPVIVRFLKEKFVATP